MACKLVLTGTENIEKMFLETFYDIKEKNKTKRFCIRKYNYTKVITQNKMKLLCPRSILTELNHNQKPAPTMTTMSCPSVERDWREILLLFLEFCDSEDLRIIHLYIFRVTMFKQFFTRAFLIPRWLPQMGEHSVIIGDQRIRLPVDR